MSFNISQEKAAHKPALSPITEPLHILEIGDKYTSHKHSESQSCSLTMTYEEISTIEQKIIVLLLKELRSTTTGVIVLGKGQNGSASSYTMKYLRVSEDGNPGINTRTFSTSCSQCL